MVVTAPRVGPLPPGPAATITTQRGQLLAVALPKRAGLSWRVARKIDARVVREVSEADVGANVVVVYRTIARGRAKIVYALTRGESTRAQAARTFTVVVR